MHAADREEMLSRFMQKYPKPHTELEFSSQLELLIAVMLSAQSTDRQVNRVTRRLFTKANTAAALLELGEQALALELHSLGLFRTKAKHIIETCRRLETQHGGQIPDSLEGLEALPGVGRKTANVVLNAAFGQATVGVDTHVFRVCNRTSLAQGKTPRAVERILIQLNLSQAYLRSLSAWLVLHGRYLCKAKNPSCSDCFISDLCQYPGKFLR